MSKSAYLGLRPCGCATAFMIDDETTTAKEIAEFARDMARSGRSVKHVTVEDRDSLANHYCAVHPDGNWRDPVPRSHADRGDG